MSTRLEFISYSPIARDPHKLFAALVRKYPNVGQAALERIAEIEVWKVKPRLDHTCVYLFGMDIFTDDLTMIEAWDAIDPSGRTYVEQHAKAGTLAKIVAIDGLSKSYAWTKRNQWVQEVTDADLPLIRNSKAKTWFRDYDRYGPWGGFQRAWEFPVAERYAFSNLDDAAKFATEVRRKQQWATSGN